MRQELISQFLADNHLGSAYIEPLIADASFRTYARISNDDGQTYIVMDAPPNRESVEPFVYIDQYLRKRGFSAPEIYAQDIENGLLLLEDFGNDSFTKLLKDPHSGIDELTLYTCAVDALIALGRASLPSKIPGYNDELLMNEVMLLPDWYMPNLEGANYSSAQRLEYIRIWKHLLSSPKAAEDVVVLRDYHADNLMWLPDREGVQRVGMLDFQDAVIGSPAYDLVSLLEDARRDVSPATVKTVLSYYASQRKTVDDEAFYAQYAMLAAQRNCKIIGIFARLAVRDNKPRYLNYIPRVWRHLAKGMEHPVLAPLHQWFSDVMDEGMRDLSYFSVPQESTQPELHVATSQ